MEVKSYQWNLQMNPTPGKLVHEMPEEMQTSKKKNAIYNPFITIIYNKNKIKRVLGHT